MFHRSLIALSAFALTSTAQYALQSNITGPSFFQAFNFSTEWDHSFGYVNYVDRPTAASMGLFNASKPGPATFGVDTTSILDAGANLGRASVRLVSYQTWQHGLFVVDLAHMPSTTCGTWPAMWLVGNGANVWPANGEIDVIEYLNLRVNNSFGLHTLPGCTVAGSGQRGTLLTNDCGADGGFAGCLASPNTPNNMGTAFNANGGGIYAVEWTSVAIRVWFFPRQAIPADITSAHPNPSHWGLPDGNFEGSCNIDSYFYNMSLDGCPALDPVNPWSSCNIYVAQNPSAFVDSYWAVNYIEVYQTEPGTPPPPSSVLSSVIPAASTSQVSSGAPEGASTTASTILSSSSSTSTPSTPPPSVASTLLSTTSSATSPATSTTAPSSTSSSADLPLVGTTTVVITTVVTVTDNSRRRQFSTMIITSTAAVVRMGPVTATPTD